MKINHILYGNSIEILKDFEENSIDAIVTDGPYGLGFMGKAWDTFTSKEYQNFCFDWGTQSLRVLKPGSLCVSFSAPKKYHRMVCGLEDAGFLIKDMINWVFGSGFPKNLDISKAIDKCFGKENERELLYVEEHSDNTPRFTTIFAEGGQRTHNVTIGATKEAKQWEGWGTGLKPAHEPIVLAQKPYEGTYAENVLKWGVGGLYIDGCRITYSPEKETDSRVGTSKTWGGKREASEHTVSLPAIEGMKMYKNKGRWPSNFVLTHHPECKLIGKKKIGTEKREKIKAGNIKETLYDGGWNPTDSPCYANEVINNYICHPDCPVRMLDAQSGELKSGGIKGKRYLHKNNIDNTISFNEIGNYTSPCISDRGGASRFFYCAKAHKSKRNKGCENLYWEKTNEGFKKITKKQYTLLPSKNRAKGNPISTLKPINLIRYLIRLVTPSNGIVLDPFAGSGTTGIACIIENFNYILIEKRKPFAEIIIPKRLKWWEEPNHWEILKDHILLPEIQMKIQKTQNKSLDTWV